MSNVGWHRVPTGHTVDTTGTSSSVPVAATEKLEYFHPMRVVKEMTDAQKETVRRFNAMQEACIKYGLMEPKSEGGA